MDGFYGENPELLTELESRGLTFVANIAVDTLVYIEKPLVGIPEKKGTRGRKPAIPRVLNTANCKNVSRIFHSKFHKLSFFVYMYLTSNGEHKQKATKVSTKLCHCYNYKNAILFRYEINSI